MRWLFQCPRNERCMLFIGTSARYSTWIPEVILYASWVSEWPVGWKAGWTIRLKESSWSVVSRPTWQVVAAGIPQGLTMGPILFNVFTNDPKTRTHCTFSNFMDNNNQGQQLICWRAELLFRGMWKGWENGLRETSCISVTHADSHMWNGIPSHTRRRWHLLARQCLWGKGSDSPAEQEAGHESAAGPVAEGNRQKLPLGKLQLAIWKHFFYHGQTLEQVAQRGCGIPVFRNFQNLIVNHHLIEPA